MANVIGEFVAKIGADMGGFNKGMGNAEKSMGGFAKSFAKHQKTIGIGIAAMGAAVAGIGILSIKAAADAEEMTAKFDTVFRDSADSVREWANVTAKAMGRSKLDFMEMAASVQDTFVPMGFARDKAAELSKQLTVLAVDVASFNNKLDADVMRDFQSALVGNTETVRKYGIVITAVGVEQEILNQGWVESKKDITEAMKVQARLNMIMDGTIDAQGDAIRTGASFTNQMKLLDAAVRDVKVAIGDQLLPIITPLVTKLGKLAADIAQWSSDNKELFETLVKIVGILGIFAAIIGPLLIVLPGLTTAVSLFGAALAVASGPVGWVTAGIALLTTGIIALIVNWDKLTGTVKEASDANEAMGDKVADSTDVMEDAQQVADDYAKSLEGAAGAAKEVADSVADMIEEINQSNTIAGLAEVTMEDLYRVMVRHGFTTEQITAMYEKFGDEQINVNEAIKAMGLSEQDAIHWIKEMEAEREASRDELFKKREGPESGRWKRQIESINARFARGSINEERYDKLLETAFRGYEESLIDYHTGGVVPGSPGQEVPIMAEAGEVVSPADRVGGITIIQHIAGSVITEREVGEIANRELVRMGRLDFTTGIKATGV